MGKNRTNPRRVPATLADVERARDEGKLWGEEFMLTAILYILHSRHEAPKEDVQQLNRELLEVLDSIGRGYLNYADMRCVLKEEADTVVELT